MKKAYLLYCLTPLFLLVLSISGCNILGASSELPKIENKDPILFKIEDLNYVKKELQKDNTKYHTAFNKLLAKANKALTSGGYSVTFKVGDSPSGNKNDYVSQAPYWWPNPDTDDGLPYVHRDGKINPEIYQYDLSSLKDLKADVETLALAYFFTDEPKYAKKAISLIEKWFLDEKTKMNPHLKFAQKIPGISKGRFIGIIDGRLFYFLKNYILLLRDSDHWTAKMEAGIVNWFNQYNSWLIEHPFGEKVKNQPNNLGTWYDVQIATYSYFLNKQNILNRVFSRLENRINEQIEPNGEQTHELSRTRSLSYSMSNLQALSTLAFLRDKVIQQKNIYTSNRNSIDNIWRYNSSNKSGSIQKAIDFLIPFFLNNKEWDYEQIGDFNACRMIPILASAHNQLKSELYIKTHRSIIDNNPTCKEGVGLLLYPIKD